MKNIKAAGDLAAKLIKKESAVELDTSNGKFTNLSNEEVADLFMSAVCGKLPQQQKKDIDDGKDE